MGVGFTSIGVTVVEIRRVEAQGPIGDFFQQTGPWRKTERASGPNTFSVLSSRGLFVEIFLQIGP